MKKPLLALGLLFSLAACADQAPPPASTTHNFQPKILLNVRVINLADRSGTQPATSPYATNHFTPTIAEAVKQWASERLQAVSQTGDAIIVIKDASLAVQPLQLDHGIDSWFTRQQGLKYMGHVQVSIEANGPQGFAMADATASRMLTLPEKPTEIEKQDAYTVMLDGLMQDLQLNLEASIHSHMNSFVADKASIASTTPEALTPPPALDAAPVVTTTTVTTTSLPAVPSVGTPTSLTAASPAPPLTVTAAPAPIATTPDATIPLSRPGM